MKKKILTIALCAALLSIAVLGSTLAYLTDTDKAENVFTVGKVDIQILESKLHRQNDGASDADIIDDADDYQDYLADAGEFMVPGRWVKKAPYIQNIGNNDAYVRLIATIPTYIYDVVDIMLYTTGFNDGSMIMGEEKEDGDNTVVTFTFTKALEPKEVTYYAPFWQFRIKPELDNEDLEKLTATDTENVISVRAEAIQAEGFEGYADAFAAFDVQKNSAK